MEASIKANRITDFVRLLQCASRFGDDLGISANKDLWELAVTNSSKSAFCLFKLHRAFFCRYKPLGTSVQQRRGVKCQLLVKSLLAVLGKTSVTGNVERVDLKIHDPDHALGGRPRRRRRDGSETNGDTSPDDESEDEVRTGIESLLIMKLVCKHGVIKRHSLHLATTEFLRADVDPDTTPSGFLISARTLREWLEHFHIGLTSSHVTTSGGTTTIRQENQLSWLFSKEEVRVKSWEGGSRELSTEVKLDPGEFEDYEVFNGRADLTLPMREFRATLALADQLSIKLVISFSEAGQPLTLTLTSEVFADSDQEPFEIFCAIATTTCDQFANVRTTSDPGSSGSQSTTSAFNRNTPRGRSTTANGDTSASQSNGNERNVRRRVNSERPATASRPRLAMSDQRPTHVSNSMPTDNTHSRNTTGENGQGVEPGLANAGDANPLFLPGGSQRDLEDTGEDPPQSQSQRHYTQAEVEQLTGLDNLDEVMDAMDDETHEEEMEEMRASQLQRQDQHHDQEDQEGEEDPGEEQPLLQSARPREPLADITMELDHSILFPPEAQEREEHNVAGEETIEQQNDPHDGGEPPVPDAEHTPVEAEGTHQPDLDAALPQAPPNAAHEDDEEPLPPTQVEPSDEVHHAVDRQFTSLFAD